MVWSRYGYRARYSSSRWLYADGDLIRHSTAAPRSKPRASPSRIRTTAPRRPPTSPRPGRRPRGPIIEADAGDGGRLDHGLSPPGSGLGRLARSYVGVRRLYLATETPFHGWNGTKLRRFESHGNGGDQTEPFTWLSRRPTAICVRCNAQVEVSFPPGLSSM